MSQGLSVFKRILSGVAILSLVFAGVTASAAQTASVSIPVSQIFKNGSSESVDAAFTYRIAPKEVGNPMPENAKDGTFTMEGTKNLSLGPITFKRVGIYEYEVSQVIKSKNTGYTYDEKVYKVMVYVKNDDADGLRTELFLIKKDGDKDGSKVESIEFSNSYQEQATVITSEDDTTTEKKTTEKKTTEKKTTEKKTTEDTTPGSSTEGSTSNGTDAKTGDFMLWPYYLLLLCAVTFFGIGLRTKHLDK